MHSLPSPFTHTYSLSAPPSQAPNQHEHVHVCLHFICVSVYRVWRRTYPCALSTGFTTQRPYIHAHKHRQTHTHTTHTHLPLSKHTAARFAALHGIYMNACCSSDDADDDDVCVCACVCVVVLGAFYWLSSPGSTRTLSQYIPSSLLTY